MVEVALGWTDRIGNAIQPYDSGDWERCLRTFQAAPRHLQRRMKPIMDSYYARLLARADRFGGHEWRLRGVVWPLPPEPTGTPSG